MTPAELRRWWPASEQMKTPKKQVTDRVIAKAERLMEYAGCAPDEMPRWVQRAVFPQPQRKRRAKR